MNLNYLNYLFLSLMEEINCNYSHFYSMLDFYMVLFTYLIFHYFISVSSLQVLQIQMDSLILVFISKIFSSHFNPPILQMVHQYYFIIYYLNFMLSFCFSVLKINCHYVFYFIQIFILVSNLTLFSILLV